MVTMLFLPAPVTFLGYIKAVFVYFIFNFSLYRIITVADLLVFKRIFYLRLNYFGRKEEGRYGSLVWAIPNI